MPSWWDSLFGDVPQPARPTSRGAMLGMGGYQNMPDMRYSITDNRADPFTEHHKEWMKDTRVGTREYAPSIAGGDRQGWADQMLTAGPTLSEGVVGADAYDPYKASFKQNWRAPARNRPAPYNPFTGKSTADWETPANLAGLTDTMGPTLPRGPMGTSRDPEMPYMGAHLPWAPGDPGWTPPPSPSGPHNRGGDISRPGYDSPVLPMDFRGLTLNSSPWGY